MKIDIDLDLWKNGDGYHTTVWFSDRLCGLHHYVIVGTDGSFSEGFDEMKLAASVGGYIDPWPNLRPRRTFGDD